MRLEAWFGCTLIGFRLKIPKYNSWPMKMDIGSLHERTPSSAPGGLTDAGHRCALSRISGASSMG